MSFKYAIYKCFDEDVEMPTAKIVAKLKVSPRYVQALRKEYKEVLESYNWKKADAERKGEKLENNDDVFDTGMEEDDRVPYWKPKTEINYLEDNNLKLSDDDIEIINMANEGGWSIQQMAENTTFSVTVIKETLNRLYHLIKSDVFDEEDENVFFKGSTSTAIATRNNIDHHVDLTQSILDELDSIPDNKTVIKKEEEYWEIEQDCVTACSKVEKSIDVFMNIKSRRKAMLYMKWAGAREWLAYLVGKMENGKYIIEDLYLPDQRTSSALVDKVDTTEFNKLPIVGVIHSHHEMGAGDVDRPSFSGHDAAFINSNHNLSLLAGRDGAGFKIVGIARTKTPCGAFIQIKALVKALVENSEEDKALKDEFLEKTMTQTQNVKKQHYCLEPTWQNKRTYFPGPDGLIETRGTGFHFTK